jgi:CRP/FNR family cyclic AMP-dependent transcriptional regulator
MPDLYFLIEFPIFREIDGDDIDALAALCEETAFNAGTPVVKEGDPADGMYILKSGVLEVCRNVGGVVKSINLLSAGEFFGEMALIDGSPRSADVICKEDAVLIRLSSDAFRKLKKENPATALKIADVLLKTLSFRVRRSTTRALSSETTALAPAPLPAIRAGASKSKGRPKKKKKLSKTKTKVKRGKKSRKN